MNWENFKYLQRKHEGLSLKPYKCTANRTTIGYGRNVQDNGITLDEAEHMLETDCTRAWNDAQTLFPKIKTYTENRQLALADMSFNLGLTKLSKFVRMRNAIENGDWNKAAKCAQESLWYKQVGNRSKWVVEQLRNG